MASMVAMFKIWNDFIDTIVFTNAHCVQIGAQLTANPLIFVSVSQVKLPCQNSTDRDCHICRGCIKPASVEAECLGWKVKFNLSCSLWINDPAKCPNFILVCSLFIFVYACYCLFVGVSFTQDQCISLDRSTRLVVLWNYFTHCKQSHFSSSCCFSWYLGM